MISLVGLTTEEISKIIERDFHVGAFRGRQIAEWLYRRTLPGANGGAAARFATMTDIPTNLRTALAERFENEDFASGEIFRDHKDGVIKAVIGLSGGPKVEAVLMPDVKRVSVCLSTQAGCPMACVFCATGAQGLSRNLSASEIVGQFLTLQSLSDRKITHAVYMGMGEPLLNLDNVLRSIHILTDEIGMSMRRITVSTVGVIRGIEKLAKENLALTLAVSLHAATDDLRVQIVPSHKTISIDRLMDTCRAYFDTTGRRITFEYVLLSNINDRPLHAQQLAKLLRGFPCAVNLIPWNPIAESGYSRPKSEDIHNFRSILEEVGIECTQRKERGRQIDAACGQLATMAHDKMPSPRPSLVLEV